MPCIESVCVTAMDVKAVVSVVTQKLKDMLKEDAVVDNKVTIHQLKGVQEFLKKLQQYSIEEDRDKIREHLLILYEVEDEIEKFAFGVARQTKFGFLKKQTLFFNNLNSCCKLCQKIKKIQIKIVRINHSNPPDIKAISPASTINERWSRHTSLTRISDASTAEEIYDAGDENYGEERIMPQKSYSSVWPISKFVRPKNGVLTRSLSAIPQLQEVVPQQKKLRFSYSLNEEEMNFVGFKEERLQYPKQMSSFSYQEEELGIYGFDKDVDILVKRLTGFNDGVNSLKNQPSKQKEKLVPIIGVVGSGKTTLVRAVYRNRKIKDHFEFREWVTVSKEDTAEHIVLSLSKKAATYKDRGAMSPEAQALKKRLYNHLKGKRYLIVLDCVGSCGVLEELIDAFPDEKDGSKIVFTSCENWRSPETSLHPHNINRLREEESWNVFLKKAGKEKEVAQIHWKVKWMILDICRGLPLNIVLIAGLLSAKKTEEWSSIIVPGLTCDRVLDLCYDDLTMHSKLLLLYMALFPKEYDIPVRRLLRLWLAEGFVRRRSRSRDLPEDIIQKHFEDLVDRNMIQITKLRSDNSPRRCRLVAVLHDYVLPKAQVIRLFYIQRNLEYSEDDEGPLGVRRIVQYTGTTGAFSTSRKERSSKVERAKGKDDAPSSSESCVSCFFSSRRKNTSAEISIPLNLQQTRSESSTLNPSLLRSYVSFNFQRKDMPGTEVGILLGRIIDSGYGLLRVLDLEGVYKPSLPDKLGHLCNLRYLGLRWTFLESLPESVGDIPYLETLDVKHTHIDSLPDSVWKLKQLRHLNLNNIRLAMPPSSSLTLLTLWGLVVDERISVKEGLEKLLGLRELGITLNLSTSQGVLIEWIAKLTNLQSLRLISRDDMGRPSKLVLKPLSDLGKLSHLNMYGNIERLPTRDEFPPTLKVLTMSISWLNKDPMETLGQLPHLIVLRLLANSYMGKKMVCHRGGFKKLRVLKLWMLKELEEWNIEEEAMQSVKEIEIRCCHKLNNIPCRLLQQGSLEELILTGMPDEFNTRVKKIIYKDTCLTVKPWDAPLPWDQDNTSQAGGDLKCTDGISMVLQPMEVESSSS